MCKCKTRQPADGNDFGPWTAYEDGGKVYIQSEDFNHDVMLVVTGDFRNMEQHLAYAQKLAAALTKATAQGLDAGTPS